MTNLDNAIAFATAGNIVLSLEIGSAYAMQVALVQIPALVCFSAIWNASRERVNSNNTILDAGSVYPGRYLGLVFQSISSFFTTVDITPTITNIEKKSEFTLVFPQWEFFTILFSVFLRT